MNLDISEFYNSIPVNISEVFKNIADYAIKLGYRVKKDKVKHIAYSFVSSKYNNGIMRFVNDKNEIKLKMKYFGIKTRNEVLEQALKETIEEYNFKYTGCYQCGKCKDKKEGYIIEYKGGKKYFRCGSEYIDINNFEKMSIEEIKITIEEQTKYYEEKLREKHRTTAST